MLYWLLIHFVTIKIKTEKIEKQRHIFPQKLKAKNKNTRKKFRKSREILDKFFQN